MLKDVLQRVPHRYENPSADFGTVMHSGAASWWTGMYVDGLNTAVAYDRARTKLVETWQQLRPSGDKHTLEMATAMFDFYTQKMTLAGPLYGEWHVAVINGLPMIEQRMLVDVDGVGTVSFQIDRLLENSKGALALVDLKSAGRLGAAWQSGFDKWLQGKLYVKGVELAFGRKLEHLVVEGLQKSVPVKHQYHTPFWDDELIDEAWWAYSALAQRDKELLERALERVGDEVLDAETFGQRFRELAEEIALTETMFNYQDCNAYGQPCPYVRLCTRPPSQRFGLLQSDYEVREQEDV